MKIALIGNPNSGKTTLFNALTGSHQHTGNWPGVTVEKKFGMSRNNEIIDLPGIYSLSPYSIEERISRDFLLNEKPDIVINIIDAANLKRNLYLTTQLLEFEVPVIIAFNMIDELDALGLHIDADGFSDEFAVPAVRLSATKGAGVPELLDLLEKPFPKRSPRCIFSERKLIAAAGDIANSDSLWTTVKLLEGDTEVSRRYDEKTLKKIASLGLKDGEHYFASQRYKYIDKITAMYTVQKYVRASESVTAKIDFYLTHKYLAIPIFLVFMLLIFLASFGGITSFLSGGIKAIFEFAAEYIHTPWPWFDSFIIDGTIAGVGSILVFLPQIAMLFFLLSVMEDSGYMARAAFIMDRLFSGFNLSGKSFIPLILGFGCTVPAICASRTLENEGQRKLTALMTPFMSCGARLPVYVMLTSAFFPENGAIVILAVYSLGIVSAIATGFIFKPICGAGSPFIMELPPYRMPKLSSIAVRVRERVMDFTVRAGTVILVFSLLCGFLERFDLGLNITDNAGASILGTLGHTIAPVFGPLGFGTWQAAVSLLTGVAAKEAVVSVLGITLPDLSAGFSRAGALSFMCFSLLYTPCLATLTTLRNEFRSLKMPVISALYQTSFAWAVSFIVYNLCNAFM